MLAHTVDHLVAIEGAFQIVPKSQLAAPSITRQDKEQQLVRRRRERKKNRNFQPAPGGIGPKNLN